MKRTILWALRQLIFVVLFNVVFFLIGGFEHPASVWISYGFIHGAYGMRVLTPFLTEKSRSAAVFGVTLGFISTVYFLAEFVLGMIFVLIGSESFRAALILQLILAGVYAVVLLSHLQANAHSADAERKQASDAAWLKDATARVRALMNQAEDPAAKKAIERVYDLLHASPVQADGETLDLEQAIAAQIACLETSVKLGDVQKMILDAEHVKRLILQRNHF